MKKILLAIGICLITAGAVLAETINYTWTAPTTGTAVEVYVVQQMIDGVLVGAETIVPTTDFAWVDIPIGSTISIRVAGRDALGRQGGYSLWADDYFDLGAPGLPGQPVADTPVIPLVQVLSTE